MADDKKSVPELALKLFPEEYPLHITDLVLTQSENGEEAELVACYVGPDGETLKPTGIHFLNVDNKLAALVGALLTIIVEHGRKKTYPSRPGTADENAALNARYELEKAAKGKTH